MIIDDQILALKYYELVPNSVTDERHEMALHVVGTNSASDMAIDLSSILASNVMADGCFVCRHR